MPSPTAPSYADFHRRSLERSRRVLGRAGAADRLGAPVRHASATRAGRRSRAGSSAAAPTCATTPSTGISPTRAAQNALICVSTETGAERVYSFARAARRSAAHGGLPAGARRRRRAIAC